MDRMTGSTSGMAPPAVIQSIESTLSTVSTLLPEPRIIDSLPRRQG